MTIKSILMTSVLAISLAACATTGTNDTAATATKAEAAAKVEAPAKESSKNVKGLAQNVSASLSDAHAAATAAMTQYGFTIKNSSDTEISGKRSGKIGVFVGSGGEKMKIKLADNNDGTTNVHVRTTKTFVGIAGQKNWDDEVMEAITSGL